MHTSGGSSRGGVGGGGGETNWPYPPPPLILFCSSPLGSAQLFNFFVELVLPHPKKIPESATAHKEYAIGGRSSLLLHCLRCRFTRNHCACAPMLYISELCEDCTVAKEIDYA